MNAKIFVGLMLTIVALVFVPAVSAFATIDYIETESIIIRQGNALNVEPGQQLDLRVAFWGTANEEDVRVTARILGEPGSYESTGRFDVFAGGVYSKLLTINVPMNIDPRETFVVEVRIESQDNTGAVMTWNLAVQRESYALDFLSIDADSKISAGETLAIDVVIKNAGGHEAEDTFVIARIHALDVSKKIFIEDLAAYDSDNNDDEDDSVSGTIYLKIPANAAAGLYTIELEANSEDAQTMATRRVEVVDGGAASMVVTSSDSKTFAANADGKYSLTIVNSGDKIMVYTLVAEADNGLTVSLEDTTVVVPAGSSKTVPVMARSKREGTYNFVVNVHDAKGAVVGEQSFTAEVEGKSAAVGSNAAVVLTIILAIVFVVLLVVLIVLLTRKPATQPQTGESYY
jgi:preprotein translocase subunit SecG